jgi:hypothetical protein
VQERGDSIYLPGSSIAASAFPSKYPDSEILDRILQVCPVTVLKKPLKIEQIYQTVKILGHNPPSQGLEQQSSRLLVGL